MPARRICPDSSDRLLIGLKIALSIGTGARSFTQHVEAGREALILGRIHALDRFIDSAAHHEHLAHQAHRGAHRLTDERFACTRDQFAQHTAPIFADHRLAED